MSVEVDLQGSKYKILGNYLPRVSEIKKKTTREHLKGLEEKDGEITGMECIGPTVLYGSETWTLKKTPNQKFLRCGSGVRWKR